MKIFFVLSHVHVSVKHVSSSLYPTGLLSNSSSCLPEIIEFSHTHVPRVRLVNTAILYRLCLLPSPDEHGGPMLLLLTRDSTPWMSIARHYFLLANIGGGGKCFISPFLLIPIYSSMSFYAAEPPVRVVSSYAEETHSYQVGDRVVLACELSRLDAPVQWYKDGEEIQQSECLLLESEGPCRRLIIPWAQLQDSGEFVCDAGSDSVFFNITVAGKRSG